MAPKGAGDPGRGRHANTAVPTRRTDDTTVRAPIELPPAPGTDALRRRLERRDPPALVVVIGVDADMPAEHHPYGRANVAVLELPADADPARIDWTAAEGLEALVLIDGLVISPELIADALLGAGAASVEIVVGPLGPGGVR